MRYRARPSRLDRLKAVSAVAAVYAVMIGALLLVRTDVPTRILEIDPTVLIDVNELPPPEPPPEPEPGKAEEEEGAAGKKAEPTPIVAPKSRRGYSGDATRSRRARCRDWQRNHGRRRYYRDRARRGRIRDGRWRRRERGRGCRRHRLRGPAAGWQFGQTSGAAASPVCGRSGLRASVADDRGHWANLRLLGPSEHRECRGRPGIMRVDDQAKPMGSGTRQARPPNYCQNPLHGDMDEGLARARSAPCRNQPALTDPCRRYPRRRPLGRRSARRSDKIR